MAAKKRQYSSYQKKVIKRFYENREQIETQRLQEIVTEIYLAGGGKKADRLWERAAALLERAEGLAPAEVERILTQRDVEGLARLATNRFDG
jgi:hypothetical protein